VCVDKLDVSGIDASTSLAGNQAFALIGGNGFTGEGQIRAIVSGGDKILQFNTTGSGGVDFEINVNNASLAAGDFLL
jgi:serralysin